MIQHEIDKALALADDIELHGHPETLCTKAAMLIRKLVSEVKVESTQYEFQFEPKKLPQGPQGSQSSEHWTNSDGS